MKTICNNNTIKHYFEKNPDAFCINEQGEWRSRSVHFESQFRSDKAQKEAQKKPVGKTQVAEHVNDFLYKIGVPKVLNPEMDPSEIDYAKLKCDYQLEDERDLVWLKFTTDGYVGVVAQSNDINFDLPPSADVYNDKDKSQHWTYNTSGIIIHQLGKRWDTSFVLVFPLKLNNVNYSRHEIETAIGNYLIDHDVPILDYYSHNY
ncbi:MAG: hypothetical protein NC254_12995 [bacterium]|nr:hypothetical protein [bacterium]